MTPIRDLDGDGILELAVGAAGDDAGAADAGAVYIVFLDASGATRAYQKITRPEAGGPSAARCARSPAPNRSSPTSLSAAPGGVGGAGGDAGAVFLFRLRVDGSPHTTMQLAPSTWRHAGPALAADARFGASLAARSMGERLYELGVGAPGADGGAGAVVAFEMGRRTVQSHAVLESPEPATLRHFGAAVAFAGDLNGDSVAEVVAGGGDGAMAVLFSGPLSSSHNRTYARRWLRLQSEGLPADSLARGVALLPLTNQSTDGASDAPLFWLTRPAAARSSRDLPAGGVGELATVHRSKQDAPFIGAKSSASAILSSLGALWVRMRSEPRVRLLTTALASLSLALMASWCVCACRRRRRKAGTTYVGGAQ